MVDYIDSFAPCGSQMGLDNSGLLIGGRDKKVTKALVSLDASRAAAEQAINAGCDLLITHHPIIFHPLKTLAATSPVYRLAAAGVDVIAAHTNLDIAPGGVNERFAEALGLTGFERMDGMEYCLLGKLPREMTAEELARHTAERLGLDTVQVVDAGHSLNTAALICGSGGGEVYDLLGKADVLITGEAGHHEMLDARDGDMSMVVAGHFQTERLIVPHLTAQLREKFPGVEFICAEEYSPVSTLVLRASQQ